MGFYPLELLRYVTGFLLDRWCFSVELEEPLLYLVVILKESSEEIFLTFATLFEVILDLTTYCM